MKSARKKKTPKLGVNIDHIATLRQLRNTPYPSMLEAATAVTEAGAQQITIHLREDRRHIQDADVYLLKKKLKIAMNLEISMAKEIVEIALKVKPDWVCVVPEKREEKTTEGGLDVRRYQDELRPMIEAFHKKKIKVSLFIEPSTEVVALSHELGADAVEIHTGHYCNAAQKAYGAESARIKKEEYKRIVDSAKLGHKLGIHVHAGHGFDYTNVKPILKTGLFEEYNIGHAIVCRAAMVGLKQATKEMMKVMKV